MWRVTLAPDMIKSFRHKDLKKFFETGDKGGIKPEHAKRLGPLLFKLDTAKAAKDMNFPGSGLHALKGKYAGFYAVKVSGNWRLIFRFEGADAYDIDYLDYH
jgi:proteic killer suppression protein